MVAKHYKFEPYGGSIELGIWAFAGVGEELLFLLNTLK